MRIRFRQIDVLWSTVHGPDGDRGFPLPPAESDDGLLWEPFQIEIRGVPTGREHLGPATRDPERIRLAVWERLVE